MGSTRIFEEKVIRAGYKTDMKNDDIYALSLLNPLLNSYSFLPFTGASLRPICLVHILNDIVINNRKSVVEFGAGISTVMIGRLIKLNNLKCTITTIDHDCHWLDTLRQVIKNDGLDGIVTAIHAPLKQGRFCLNANYWYDQDILNDNLPSGVEMVIVDGPPAYETGKEQSRYPALPFIFKKLTNTSAVYLDDANRQGERSVIEKWEKEFDIKFIFTAKTLAYFTVGKSFYAGPAGY